MTRDIDEKELRNALNWGAKYGTVPQGSQDIFLRDYFDNIALAIGTYNLVNFEVGRGRVLDLTVIRFRLGNVAPGHLLVDAADDLAGLLWLRFLVRVHGRSPMDQGATIAAGTQPKPPAGFFVLNRNVLGDGDDTPTSHLIVREGQRVKVDYVVTNPPPFDQAAIGVELKGRWIMQKHYNDIMKVKL